MSDIASFEQIDPAAATPEPRPAPLPTPQPVEGSAPQPAPLRRSPVLGVLPIVAVTLAAIASVASAAGLIVATRNVSETQHVIAELARAHAPGAMPVPHAAPPATSPAPRIRPAVVRQDDIAAATAALEAMPAIATPADGRYATITELRAALADLRQDLAKHQGPGNVMVMAAMRDGQTDLANRISDLATKVDRLDRTLSSSRKAQP